MLSSNEPGKGHAPNRIKPDRLTSPGDRAARRRARNLYVLIGLLIAAAIILVLADSGPARPPTTHAQKPLPPVRSQKPPAQSKAPREKLRNFDAQIVTYANQLLDEGRTAFRFDTFGGEVFWGGALQLHQAIKGANLGGVGPGISPSTALSLGLKVDLDALPQPLINQLRRGEVDLNDPATTIALLKLDAVVGLIFRDPRLDRLVLETLRP